MKRLSLIFLLLLTVLPAWSQAPIRRQFFTTNDNPIVDVVAGSNATVQASTPAANIRRFTVNAVPTVGQTNNTVVVALTNIVVVTNTSGGNTVYSIGGLTDTNIVTAIARAQTNGLATTNFVLGSQVWTNDGGLIWPSGYPKPIGGVATSTGPPIMVNTNGSIYMGRNVAEDNPFTMGNTLQTYLISMVRSNDPPYVQHSYGAISDENYDFYSTGLFSALGNKDTGTSGLNLDVALTNGRTASFSVRLDPSSGLAGNSYIFLRTNNVPVFDVDNSGTVAIKGIYYGNGAGLTNLPSGGTGSSNITDNAYYAVARNLSVNTNAEINNLVVTNLTVDSGSGIGYLSLENSGTNIITLNGTNGTITSVTNIAQQFIGDGTGLSNVPFAIFTNYAVSADYTNVGALAFGTNLYGMTSFWTYASVPIVGTVPIFNFGIDTNTVITTNGGAFSGRILQNNASSISAPLTNELVTAGWTRNLFTAANIPYYTSTNIDTAATNVGSSQVVYQYLGSIPISFARSYAAAFLTNGGYLGATMTTNTFQELGGGVLVAPVVGWSGGSGTRSLSYKSELYISTDKTNWYGDWSSGIITLSADTTNYTPVLVDVPRTVATNAGGFYLQRRLKITSVTYSGSPTVWFLGGTNALTGTADASHISLPSPTSTAGNAYLAANQVFSGSNYFVQPIQGPIPGSNIVGSINAILVGTITNEVAAAGLIQGTNGFASGIKTVATLPASPIAGQTVWASDVVTSRGTGDFCHWDGTNWRTRENVIATADIKTFILNAYKAQLNVNSDIGFIGSSYSCSGINQASLSLSGFIPVAGGASGSGAGWSVTTVTSYGGVLACFTGSTSTGDGRVTGAVLPAMAANDYYACGSAIGTINQSDGTDNFAIWSGISGTVNSGSSPTTGAYFLYDRYTNSIGALYAANISYTNNWICVMANSSTYQFADTGLPAYVNGSVSSCTNRLAVVATTAGCYFYTNGVLSSTLSSGASIPTGVLFVGSTAVKKSLGSNIRYVYSSFPMVHVRKATAVPLP